MGISLKSVRILESEREKEWRRFCGEGQRSELTVRKRESDRRKVERRGESEKKKERKRERESGGEREKCCVSLGQIRLGDVIKIGKMCLMNIHLCLDLRY